MYPNNRYFWKGKKYWHEKEKISQEMKMKIKFQNFNQKKKNKFDRALLYSQLISSHST